MGVRSPADGGSAPGRTGPVAEAWSAGDVPAEDLSFAARLNRLIASVHPLGRRPYRDIEIADGLASFGHSISRPYLSQLRSGRRTQPSEATIHAFARFFRVDVEYFTDDEYYLRVRDELTWMTWPCDDLVADIARGLSGLSSGALDEIDRTINRIRRSNRP